MMYDTSSGSESEQDEHDEKNDNIDNLFVNIRSKSRRLGLSLHAQSMPDFPSRFSDTDSTNGSAAAAAAPVRSNSDSYETSIDVESLRHRQNLQLYVLVARCIAYPFNADAVRPRAASGDASGLPAVRKAKLTDNQLSIVQVRFAAFLSGSRQYPTVIANDVFKTTVRQFNASVFDDGGATAKRIAASGAFCQEDLHDVFKMFAERALRRIVAGVGGDSQPIREAVMNSWLTQFANIVSGGSGFQQASKDDTPRSSAADNHGAEAKDATDNVPSTLTVAASERKPAADNHDKCHLYDLFQKILGVKKYEHQILFNAIQLDNVDEQVTQIRRELAARQRHVNSIRANRVLTHGEAESVYVRLLRYDVDQVMSHLEAMPVVPVESSALLMTPLSVYQRNRVKSRIDLSAPDFATGNMSWLHVVLTFSLEVTIHKVRGLSPAVADGKRIYCTMGVKGSDKLQTDVVNAIHPHWDTTGYFVTKTPLPRVKVKLLMEDRKLLSLSDKELGRLVLTPNLLDEEAPKWYNLTSKKKNAERNIQMKISTCFDRPQNLKHCGYLYAQGRDIWRKWERRYFMLIQVSQCRYAICSYAGKLNGLTMVRQLNGYTVDYCDPPTQAVLPGGTFYFTASKENDRLTFATDDELERVVWVHTLCRATGQSYRPRQSMAFPLPISRSSQVARDFEKAKKFGFEEFILAEPTSLDHDQLFSRLQGLAVDSRLSGTEVSMGELGWGETFVFDEYCARYGVRTIKRHIYYIAELLSHAQRGCAIDPRLVIDSLNICSFIAYPPDSDAPRLANVLEEETAALLEIRKRLVDFVDRQITNFRTCFPFGHPKSALRSTIALLENLVVQTDVRSILENFLHQAADANYEALRIRDCISSDDSSAAGDGPATLDDLVLLAERCINLQGEIEECHDFGDFDGSDDLMINYAEAFWMLFSADMDRLILSSDETGCVEQFQLFQLLNEYVNHSDRLRCGLFDKHLTGVFSRLLEERVILAEQAVDRHINDDLPLETWELHGSGCATSEFIFWKLDSLDVLISELRFTDLSFVTRIQQKTKAIRVKAIRDTMQVVEEFFDERLPSRKSSGSAEELADVPIEVFVMLNVAVNCRKQSTIDAELEKLVEEAQTKMTCSILQRLADQLERTLGQLLRTRRHSTISSFWLFRKTPDETTDNYIDFVRRHAARICDTVVDRSTAVGLLEMWCMATTSKLSDWLMSTGELSSCQADCMTSIAVDCLHEFETRGVPDSVLNNNMYRVVSERLRQEQMRQRRQTPRARRRSDVTTIWRPTIVTQPTVY